MKLLFLAFRYVAAGGGVCCAPHRSLLGYVDTGSFAACSGSFIFFNTTSEIPRPIGGGVYFRIIPMSNGCGVFIKNANTQN